MIQCGLYRTGTLWAHSTLPADCHPDIITMAKPLGNGYPIGAILLRDVIAATMTTGEPTGNEALSCTYQMVPGTHGTTFGGSPLACAVGHHVLSRLSCPEFVAGVRAASAHLLSRLEVLPTMFPDILQPNIRGRGLITGLGFKDESGAGRLVGMARERGVLLLTGGKDALRIVPSLCIGKEEVDMAVEVIESCLGEL